MHKWYLIIILLFLFSCNGIKNNNDKTVARVGKEYLYLSDIINSIPNNISKQDSISYAKNYIDKWIKNQLVLEKAELNLAENQKEINKQTKDYRAFLLINKYQQTLLKQKLDTIVTLNDIEEYYNEHKGEFKLKFNVVKINYIKLPIATYDSHKVRRWYRSDDKNDKNDLEDYCYQNAHNFEFSDEWIDFNNILNVIPLKVKDHKEYIKSRKFIEITDSLYRYFLRIKEYKIINDTAPMSIIKNDLKTIILNKRKIQFLNELENNVYNDAIEKNKIEYFNN